MKEKHLMIDANNLIYRSYFVTKKAAPKDPKVRGKELKEKKKIRKKRIENNIGLGIHNAVKMIQFNIKKFNPTSVVICWDGGKSEARRKLYPEYKAQRDKNRKEEDVKALNKVRVRLQNILSHLPFKNLQIEGVEADDVIGYLVQKKLKGKKIIISNDNDFFQLIDKKTKMFYPNKMKLLTVNNIDKFIGFPLEHYVLWKSMVGDSSDNIKGIVGIGKARADKIIKNGLVSDKKLPIREDQLETLRLCRKLITIGEILTKEDKKNIRVLYKREGKKRDFKYGKLRGILVGYKLRKLLYDYEEWLYDVRKLEPVKDGKDNEKTKKRKNKKK